MMLKLFNEYREVLKILVLLLFFHFLGDVLHKEKNQHTTNAIL